MDTPSDSSGNKRMPRIKVDFGYWREVLIVGALSLLLIGLLLSPTVKTVRSVEIGSEYAGTILHAGDELEQVLSLPDGEAVSYFVVWVSERPDGDLLTASDYRTLAVEVLGDAGEILRRDATPMFIKRLDHPALLYRFDELDGFSGERLRFVLRQEGAGSVGLRKPEVDHIVEGDQVTMAYQFGVQRNWLTLLMGIVYEEDFDGHDISSYFHRGQQIVAGENPYSCVLDEQQECVGYPAHLPGMYWVTSAFVLAGVDNMDAWESAWRPVAIMAWLGVGLLLFMYIYRMGQSALAVATLAFWLFNRWSIEVLIISHTDFIGVFLLLLAVMLARRFPRWAAVLFGASLAVKQLAALAVPVFLLLLWRQENSRFRSLLLLTSLLMLVPVLVTLPFLADDFDATVTGLINVVERPAQNVHGFAASYDERIDVTHLGKSSLLLFLVFAVYVAAWRNKITLVGGMLMVFAIMMAFTHVLFHQYFIWFIVFIPLAVAHLMEQRIDEAESVQNKE